MFDKTFTRTHDDRQTASIRFLFSSRAQNNRNDPSHAYDAYVKWEPMTRPIMYVYWGPRWVFNRHDLGTSYTGETALNTIAFTEVQDYICANWWHVLTGVCKW